MSKIMKIFLIVGICLTVLGMTLCGVSLALGFSGGFGITSDFKYVEFPDEEVYVPLTQLSDITDIDADISLGEVELIPSDGFFIEYDGVVKLDYEVKDGTLRLKSRNNDRWFLMQIGDLRHRKKAPKLRIYIPQEAELGTVSISCDLGSIAVSGLNCRELSLDAALGEVSAKDVKADVLNVNADLGDIRVRNISADIINSENSCGNTVLKSISATEGVNVSASMGNVELALTGGDYSFDLETDLGQTKLFGRERGSSVIYDGGPVRVRIRNSCGDIVVE